MNTYVALLLKKIIPYMLYKYPHFCEELVYVLNYY